MNIGRVLVVLAAALFAVEAVSIDHDKVKSFPQPAPVTISEKAAVKFKPFLAVHKASCVTFPAVNSAGETSGGLKGTNYNKGCTNAPLGSQVYGRARWYRDIWAIMYAWYFPKGFRDADPYRRHNWASTVVWIDPALETPKVLGLSLSTSDTKYNHLAPVSFANRTTPYLLMAVNPFDDFELTSIDSALGSSSCGSNSRTRLIRHSTTRKALASLSFP